MFYYYGGPKKGKYIYVNHILYMQI